eukprot:442153-Amphidinium_carterae.1
MSTAATRTTSTSSSMSTAATRTTSTSSSVSTAATRTTSTSSTVSTRAVSSTTSTLSSSSTSTHHTTAAALPFTPPDTPKPGSHLHTSDRRGFLSRGFGETKFSSGSWPAAVQFSPTIKIASADWLYLGALLAVVVCASAIVCCMHRAPRPGVLRDPPYWSPGDESRHPFRNYLQDLTLWLIHSDLDLAQQVAAVISQLGGTAREVARTLTPQELMHGGVISGHHLDPVSYLLHGLSTRFAPLEEENRLRVVSELLSFTRRPGESIDALLTRYELVRLRALREGGGAAQLGPEPTSLMLLKACGVTHHQFLQLTQSIGHRLPSTEAEFEELCRQLRRLGHILEQYPNNVAQQLGTRASVPPASGHRQAYYQENAWDDPWHQDGADPWAAAAPEAARLESWADQPEDAAPAFWTNPEDHESSWSSTETEWEEDEPDFTDVAGLAPEEAQQRLYWQYTQAKRRWRGFVNKPPRRFRRTVRRKGKGKGGKGRPPTDAYWASAWAYFKGAKGKKGGKGKGKSGGKQNPRDQQGRTMRCHRCGSTEHLIARCPHPAPPQSMPAASSHMVMEAATSNLGSFERHGLVQPATQLLAHAVLDATVVSSESSW